MLFRKLHGRYRYRYRFSAFGNYMIVTDVPWKLWLFSLDLKSRHVRVKFRKWTSKKALLNENKHEEQSVPILEKKGRIRYIQKGHYLQWLTLHLG